MSDYLAAHRAFYDAIETGDADLMAALWVDDPGTSVVHPGAPPLRGTSAVLRSWTVLMANVGYIQFFLTDLESTSFPRGAAEPAVVVITCTENILSGGAPTAEETFTGGKAVCTSVLVREPAITGRAWKFWSRHASPVVDPNDNEMEDL